MIHSCGNWLGSNLFMEKMCYFTEGLWKLPSFVENSQREFAKFTKISWAVHQPSLQGRIIINYKLVTSSNASLFTFLFETWIYNYKCLGLIKSMNRIVFPNQHVKYSLDNVCHVLYKKHIQELFSLTWVNDTLSSFNTIEVLVINRTQNWHVLNTVNKTCDWWYQEDWPTDAHCASASTITGTKLQFIEVWCKVNRVLIETYW